LAEVGISGALFFGSFAFGELAVLIRLHNQFLVARFFWTNKRNEQSKFQDKESDNS